MTERGMLIVLSGPSGVGKGTVRKALFEDPNIDFQYSISATTRQPREGEKNGVDYFFLSKEEFEQRIMQGDMLEYAQYVDNYYGTPKSFIDETLESGKDVFLEIEVNGAMQVRKRMPEGIFIFLTPPDIEELEQRLVGRGTDSQEVIKNRIETAKSELKMMINYDYSVVNDEISNAVDAIKAIIKAERLKVSRVIDHYV